MGCSSAPETGGAVTSHSLAGFLVPLFWPVSDRASVPYGVARSAPPGCKRRPAKARREARQPARSETSRSLSGNTGGGRPQRVEKHAARARKQGGSPQFREHRRCLRRVIVALPCAEQVCLTSQMSVYSCLRFENLSPVVSTGCWRGAGTGPQFYTSHDAYHKGVS